MATTGSKQPETSDEIDLGQLFRLIGNGFRNLFRWFLSVYLYFKRNFFWFAGLVILGGVIGFLVNQFVEDKQKLVVIVTPNLDTKNYLYDAISEIQSEIKAQDTAFFQSMGMDVTNMEGFEIEATPIRDEEQNNPGGSEMLELLKDFGSNDAITDIVREEFRDKTTKDQRITFFFKNPDTGEVYARRILEYINSNEYYTQLLETQRTNAEERIRRNDSLVRQIDILISNYTEKIARQDTGSEGRLVLENQEALDVPSLFEMKNRLIRDTELKRLELQKQKEAITVVNFGKPHKINKPIFRKNIVFFPLLFVGAFLLISGLRFLNRKADELVS